MRAHVEPGNAGAKKKVLVADDHPATVELVRAVLEQAGYAVACAGDGAECLAMVQTEAPDLLILDLSMPRMGGVEILSRLQRRGDDNPLPVLVLTGRADLHLTAEGPVWPPELCLRKPISSEALIAAAARALEVDRTLP